MQQLLPNVCIFINFGAPSSTSVGNYSKDGIIVWANHTAVCFKSAGEEYVVPWTAITYLKVLSQKPD